MFLKCLEVLVFFCWLLYEGFTVSVLVWDLQRVLVFLLVGFFEHFRSAAPVFVGWLLGRFWINNTLFG